MGKGDIIMDLRVILEFCFRLYNLETSDDVVMFSGDYSLIIPALSNLGLVLALNEP